MRISKNRLILGILFTGVLFRAFSQPGELYGCCCLMPTAGCLIGMAMKRDTIKERIAKERWEKTKDLPWYRKLSFGIGYSGGVCWTGEDLERENPPPLDPTAKLYWLNSIGGFISYRINKDWEVGIEYLCFSKELGELASNISTRPYTFIHEESNYTFLGDGLVLLLKNKRIAPRLWLFLGYVWTQGIFEEYVDMWGPHNVDTVFTIKNKGKGIILGLELEEHIPFIFSYFELIPAIGVEIGQSWEFWNDAKYPIKWLDPLDIIFTGLYLNFRILIKGGAQ